jgi:hypothetical protein
VYCVGLDLLPLLQKRSARPRPAKVLQLGTGVEAISSSPNSIRGRCHVKESLQDCLKSFSLRKEKGTGLAWEDRVVLLPTIWVDGFTISSSDEQPPLRRTKSRCLIWVSRFTIIRQAFVLVNGLWPHSLGWNWQSHKSSWIRVFMRVTLEPGCGIRSGKFRFQI